MVSPGAKGRSQGDPQPTRLHPGAHCFLCGPCQHLVTFCLGEDAIHTVEDASQKLALMDSQGRIWAQDMLLSVSPSHVTLLDPLSKVPGARGGKEPLNREPGPRGIRGVAPFLSLTSSSMTPTPGGGGGVALSSAYFCRPRCRGHSGVSAAPGLSLPAAPPLQEELESYPVSAIVRCDTVRPPGQRRPLLLLVCQEPERAQPDVHFFQGRSVGVREPGRGPEPGAGWGGPSPLGAWPGAKAGSGSRRGRGLERNSVTEVVGEDRLN